MGLQVAGLQHATVSFWVTAAFAHSPVPVGRQLLDAAEVAAEVVSEAVVGGAVVTQFVVTEEQVVVRHRLLRTPQLTLHCSLQSLPAQPLAHSVFALTKLQQRDLK